MSHKKRTSVVLTLSLLVGGIAIAPRDARGEDKLQVCATTPDLGGLAREVGGDEVTVTVFVPPKGDAHFLEARPSFIKALSKADIFILNGLELEVGWAPNLWENARNSKVLPGNPGFVDCSKVIEPLQVPSGTLDRSMGDVHPQGNPHYLLDPVNGLRVAERIRDALSAARPAKENYFKERFTAFQDRLGVALVGQALAKKYDVKKLAVLFERGKLDAFLKKQNELDLLDGWFKKMLPLFGKRAVTDHNMWAYFAHRYGLEIVGFMEPKPGVPPTTKHLTELVEKMKTREVKVVLSEVYYDPQYARFLNEKSGATVLSMAHQVGSRPGTDDYVAMCDYNVKQLVEALGDKTSAGKSEQKPADKAAGEKPAAEKPAAEKSAEKPAEKK